jgi:AraC-like DNA-binding protein
MIVRRTEMNFRINGGRESQQYQKIITQANLSEPEFQDYLQRKLGQPYEKMLRECLKDRKILVIGPAFFNERILEEIVGKLGLHRSRVEVMKEYDKNGRTSFLYLQGSRKYAGILLGPVDHHSKKLGRHSSLSSLFRRETGFPPCREILTASGEMKISKNSFRQALCRLIFDLLNTYFNPVSCNPQAQPVPAGLG